MSKKNIKTIHISIGDPSGIGPEIVSKSLITIENIENIFVIHCNREVLEKSSQLKSNFITGEYNSNITTPGIYIKTIHTDPNFNFGEISSNSGKIAAESIVSATKLCKKGEYLVTAPLNKEALNLAGYNFQGHTEMLKELTHSDEVFMSFWGAINTLLITSHISLKEMIDKISDEEFVYNKIVNSYKYIKDIIGNDFKPVMAGLNPHAGENGLMGDEEKVLKKVLERLKRQEDIIIDGPLPPDTLFATYLTGKYNFVYSLYHDQALIPIKTFFMDRTLNLTLGLPFIRVSPDHGTAFDIAGKNKADYSAISFCYNFINRL